MAKEDIDQIVVVIINNRHKSLWFNYMFKGNPGFQGTVHYLLRKVRGGDGRREAHAMNSQYVHVLKPIYE